MADIPYNEPTSIRAGDTISWKKTVADYPPSAGYTLKYALRNATNKIDITCTTSGSDYLASVTAATSVAYSVGRYTWAAYVTKGADVNLEQHTIDTGTVDILPNLSVSVAYETRSDARIIYDGLITAYKTFIASGSANVTEMTIAGKTIRFDKAEQYIVQIEKWRRIVQAEDDAEKAAKGFGTSRRVGIRLTRP